MMILRLVVLMLGGALAYLLLRGWPSWLPNFLGACLAVLVLVLALGWWAIGAPRGPKKGDALPDATLPRKPSWLDFVSLGMGLLAVECAFLWVLSVAPDPLEQLAVRIEQRFRPAAAEERVRAGEGGQVSGNWLWQDEGRRKLPARTNLKPGPKPEVFVRLLDGEDAERLLERQVYVRAFVMNRFVDGTWSPGETDVVTRQANEDGWIRFADEAEGEMLHEVFLGESAGDRQAFAALQGARGVRLPSLQVVSEGIAYLPSSNKEDGHEYLASSVPLHLADLSPEMRLVQVSEPRTVSDRTDALARRVGGEGSLQEQLRRIERYLKTNYEYSLKTENRRDLDPLENFLFEEKRGHCEFFATAGAVMARSLGAEVRMAYGWAGGQFFEMGNTFVFRARDAHAWVEVKVADAWVVMDPTPAIAFGGAERPEIAEANEKMPDSEEVLEKETFSFGSGGGGFSTMFLALTGVFGCAAGVVFLVKARRHRCCGVGVDRFSVRGRGDPSYLADWRRALKAHGISSPQGLTLMGQVKSMAEAPDFAEDLLSYHYAVTYEQEPPNASMEREFRRKIKAWGAFH